MSASKSANEAPHSKAEQNLSVTHFFLIFTAEVFSDPTGKSQPSFVNLFLKSNSLAKSGASRD
jgi:hypothetical protein